MWNLTVSVPYHCLFIYLAFIYTYNFDTVSYYALIKQKFGTGTIDNTEIHASGPQGQLKSKKISNDQELIQSDPTS